MTLVRRARVRVPNEPSCEQVGAVLQAYLDGELDPSGTDAVHAHLEHCRRCGIEADTVRRVIDAIAARRPDLDPDALARLAGLLDDLEAGGRRPES